MHKLFLFILLTLTPLLATFSKDYITPSFMSKKMVIIDIRTSGEWEKTGILKNSILATFFDMQGRYDVKKFISIINKHVKHGETFALICETGSRSNMLASFLGQNGYNVIDLTNGISGALKLGIKLQPYKAK